ncbi:MAG TPA: cell division protein FtsA [Stellaceae bacterium]|nr:cell division protein FtsA [Stellaceae bacterium]
MSRSAPRRSGSLLAAIDIGTTKVVCFIARREAKGPKILGIGHQISRGVKNGLVVDLDAAATSTLNAVHAAEQMAGETITEAVVNLSGGFPASRIVPVEIAIGGREIGDADMKRVLGQGHAHREAPDRQIIHSIPVGFSIDGGPGVRDPRGMFGDRLGVNMHIVSANGAAVRNIVAAIGRCHLEVSAMIVSPYAAGLAALVADEQELGGTVIDMGGGTTSIAVFHDGAIVFADSVPVGGVHVTNDIARGLVTPIAHAERLKTLYGSATPSARDERETVGVQAIGEDEGQVTNVPKSHLVGIITPRVEETLELVRDRLEKSGFDRLVGHGVVLTGGASQLPGTREVAAMILDKQVRLGKPLRITGLAEATQGPAFATTAGLLHFAASETAELRGRDFDAFAGSRGAFGRLGSWLRENL